MRKSRFTETQIIGMIKEQEAGLTVADVLGLKIEVRHRQPEGHRMLPWTDTTST